MDVKEALVQHCMKLINSRIQTAHQSMEAAQKAANSETKSSVGDKYETGRAMMQLEKEKNARQLAQCLQLKQQLVQTDFSSNSETIGPGSLVYTNHGNFIIGIGLGKISYDNQPWLSISTLSPIGKQLKGLKIGASFSFNNKTYEILKVL